MYKGIKNKGEFKGRQVLVLVSFFRAWNLGGAENREETRLLLP